MIHIDGHVEHVMETPQNYIRIVDDCQTEGTQRQFLVNTLTLEDVELPQDKVVRIEGLRHTRRPRLNNTTVNGLGSER